MKQQTLAMAGDQGFEQHRKPTTVTQVLIDGGYTGEQFEHRTWQILGAKVQVAKRNELHKFVIIPKRWVVERSFPLAGGMSTAMEELRVKTQHQLAVRRPRFHCSLATKTLNRLLDFDSKKRATT